MERFIKDPSTWEEIPVLKPEANLAERTTWILQAYTTFPAMSNNELRGGLNDKTNWGSLEDIHNAIHVLVGTGGHMSHIEVSAFDPVFWLRKCPSMIELCADLI